MRFEFDIPLEKLILFPPMTELERWDAVYTSLEPFVPTLIPAVLPAGAWP